MKLIQPSVEILSNNDPYKMIEIAGRTCYKSEDKITEDSCKEFVQRMIDNGHTAMLEHGTIYLCREGYWSLFYKDNPYSKVTQDSDGNHCITTNLRVLQENNCMSDLQYLCSPTEYHLKRITVRFTCDRGVSHELVRHRVFSFAQESTRFCNYSKGKFGGEITYILPSWWNNANQSCKNLFLDSLSTAEDCYTEMIDCGCTPQEARQVLPNALKTEVVMTGFVSDWKHFFELRCAKNAHPDMQYLANKLKEQFEEQNLL